jgi:hypothetical protein
VLFYLRQVLDRLGYTLEDAAVVLVDKLAGQGPPIA